MYLIIVTVGFKFTLCLINVVLSKIRIPSRKKYSSYNIFLLRICNFYYLYLFIRVLESSVSLLRDVEKLRPKVLIPT